MHIIFSILNVDRQHEGKRKNFQQLIWLVKWGNKGKKWNFPLRRRNWKDNGFAGESHRNGFIKLIKRYNFVLSLGMLLLLRKGRSEADREENFSFIFRCISRCCESKRYKILLQSLFAPFSFLSIFLLTREK